MQHVGMGDDEVGLTDRPVVVEQNVDVDGSVVIDAVGRFVLSAQVLLDLLGEPKDFTRQQTGLAADGGVEEQVVGMESPRFCLKES